ncbi:hypothetical protein [Leifsonia sp. Leaf264]|uniref:hypothetical protein n=1 Tax=Leifsonia sp. Leaf264 TaxID=1736314 RepID=UPI0006F598A7|nr:hypothetical protein [Leifsonia sp. Leaf264]KQO98382.1 hypothetical protein ASF30_09995 [Leifsonia sp. Leaf264]
MDALIARTCPVCGGERVGDTDAEAVDAIKGHLRRDHTLRPVDLFLGFPKDAAVTVGAGKVLHRYAGGVSMGGKIPLRSIGGSKKTEADPAKNRRDGVTFWSLRHGYPNPTFVDHQDGIQLAADYNPEEHL